MEPAPPARPPFWPDIIIAVAGAMAVLGSILPWVTATTEQTTFSENGVQGGDGIITIAGGVGIALIGITLLIWNDAPRRARISVTILGIVLAWFSISAIASVDDRAAGLDPGVVTASPGVGLVIIVAAATIAVVLGMLPAGTRQD